LAKKLPGIGDRFAESTEQISLEKTVADLRQKLENQQATSTDLEQDLQRLRENLSQSSGEVEIDLTLIDANPQQPRQTITESLIRAKARSLDKHGQITSIILVEQQNRYLLLDGQLRWEAAKFLGWSTIRAVIAPMPSDLDRSALVTFLGFEDLNSLDKAEAVFREVEKSLELPVESAITILHRAIKRIEVKGQIKEISNLLTLTTQAQQDVLSSLPIDVEESELLLSLLDLGLNPNSVKTNLVPMLSLPPDLKAAIRQQGLKGYHAQALATLSAKVLRISEEAATTIRVEATSQVLAEQLTVVQTRKLVKEIRDKYQQGDKLASTEVSAFLKKVNTLSHGVLASSPPQQLQELRSALEMKLQEIDRALRI